MEALLDVKKEVGKMREFSGYFGRRYHVITAHKEHTCKLCGSIIEAGTKCIRVFKPVIGERNGMRQRFGFIQTFYHVECVERDFALKKFKKEQEHQAQIKKCISLNCPHFINGHCAISAGGTLLIDFFDECVKVENDGGTKKRSREG